MILHLRTLSRRFFGHLLKFLLFKDDKTSTDHHHVSLSFFVCSFVNPGIFFLDSTMLDFSSSMVTSGTSHISACTSSHNKPSLHFKISKYALFGFCLVFISLRLTQNYVYCIILMLFDGCFPCNNQIVV